MCRLMLAADRIVLELPTLLSGTQACSGVIMAKLPTRPQAQKDILKYVG